MSYIVFVIGQHTIWTYWDGPNWKAENKHNRQSVHLRTDWLSDKVAPGRRHKNKTAEEVTQCMLKFVYQFECPKRILTDQGREFVNEVCMKNYRHEINIHNEHLLQT